jgi:predicted secreted protein
MPDAAALFAQGTQLKIGNGADPEVFTTIYGCGPITGPGKSRDTVDVTTHSSPNGQREFIGGLRDGMEISCDVNWVFDDPGQNALETAYASDDPVNYQVVYTFTDLNETDNFAGLVTALNSSSPTDAQYKEALTIKITGPVTRTNDES